VSIGGCGQDEICDHHNLGRNRSRRVQIPPKALVLILLNVKKGFDIGP